MDRREGRQTGAAHLVSQCLHRCHLPGGRAWARAHHLAPLQRVELLALGRAQPQHAAGQLLREKRRGGIRGRAAGAAGEAEGGDRSRGGYRCVAQAVEGQGQATSANRQGRTPACGIARSPPPRLLLTSEFEPSLNLRPPNTKTLQGGAEDPGARRERQAEWWLRAPARSPPE